MIIIIIILNIIIFYLKNKHNIKSELKVFFFQYNFNTWNERKSVSVWTYLISGLEDKDQNHPPNLTVKRSFTARNTGVLPLTITDFSINGQQCQGYGFRILNCQPFHLPANSSKKVKTKICAKYLTKCASTLCLVYQLSLPKVLL